MPGVNIASMNCAEYFRSARVLEADRFPHTLTIGGTSPGYVDEAKTLPSDSITVLTWPR